MDIKDLIKLWNSEKEFYSTAEVGSGVQKFVKEVFKCSALFNLKEGKLSTDISKRNKEFIEEAQKKGHRADVVIFINSEVVIPVEIERYTNLKNGEKQIFQYQTDWQKKFGLLTDGYYWRFYNNLFIEKTFTIEEIFEKTSEFLTFWNEYTKSENYYISFFEKQGQKEFYEIETPNVDDVRNDFFFDITQLIETFKNKLKLKGFFVNIKEDSEKNKKAIEITYAYLIQFILYKTLVDNSFAGFDEDWIERLKSIDKALKAEIYGDILNKIVAISDKISDKVYKKFSDEQLLINDRLREILQKPKQVIEEISAWLDILLFISRYNFANVQNEIFGYVYENYLKDLYLDESKGQYFTDPEVADFMLTEMGFNKEEIQKRYEEDKTSISIIDPSCGSGTFLYNATARLVASFYDGTRKTANETEDIINDNIFGLDISEFPLYLAEMNILMRMLPVIIGKEYNSPYKDKIRVFKTRDSIAEFLDTSIRNTLTDINQEIAQKGAVQLSLFSDALDLGYDSFMRDKRNLNILKESVEINDQIPRRKFDYVVGNPPYVGYNECARQGILTFQFIKENKIKLNDIYGINLHSVKNNPKKYRPNPNLYAFFICLGLALLKDTGKISFIIPQTLLTAGDLDVIRYYLSKFVTINKIVIFENKMFVGRGLNQKKSIPTSSLIFFVQKETPNYSHSVEIINYLKKDVNAKICIKDIKKRKNCEILKVKQTKLLQYFENWNFLRFRKHQLSLFENYKNNENISIYYQHNLSEIFFNSKFIFDGGYSINEKERLYVEPDTDYYIYPKFQYPSFTKVIPNGYWLNHRNKEQTHFIGLRQGSQSYLLLDSKYKIVWSYTNLKHFYFTHKPIIWARNQFNAIGSDNKKELLYLYSLLNSKLNIFLLKSYLMCENEKSFLVSISSIKKFIKVPNITEKNISLKLEIISKAEEMINMESQQLSDYVDFSNVLLQKFDNITFEENSLSIQHKGNSVKCEILKNKELIEKSINEKYINNLDFKESLISDLKEIPVYDVDYQMEIKNYIDDLVFALYFNIELDVLGFENRERIKEMCSRNEFYLEIGGEEL
ncbi:MAG TPA: N-6 DNA methylase [Candidatus Kapabacteria bacterium]|nr:N-6 DNA methylase [Candidatus Kapabacteria bacterium]